MPSSNYSTWRAQRLTDPERAAKYLTAALEESPEDFLYALKNVIQANQVSSVAKRAGVQRESLYRSFSLKGNPTWTTMQSVLRAVGVEFPGVQAISTAGASSLVPRTPISAGTKKRRARRKTAGTTYCQLELPFQQAVPTPRAALSPVVNAAEQYGKGVTETRPIVAEVPTLPGFFLQQQYGAGAVTNAAS